MSARCLKMLRCNTGLVKNREPAEEESEEAESGLGLDVGFLHTKYRN